MRGLDFRPLQIPLAAGLNQKVDERALQAPSLLIAKDVQFDDHGALQTRYPFTSLGSFGETVRAVVANGDELLCFTESLLYSYDEGANTWRSRGTHLAVKVEETPRFVTTGDQVNCDRAELGNTIAYCWEDNGTTVLALVDRLSGAVKMSPGVRNSSLRPKLIALTTKILNFYVDTFSGTNDLYVTSIDPTTLAVSAPTLLIGGGAGNLYYDVCKVAGADQAAFVSRRTPTTSYSVGTVTAGLVVAQTTKARTCDGPIAVSCNPDGVLQIVRGNAMNIQGDAVVASGFADDFTNQAIGTVTSLPVRQIACAHRSVTDAGEWRCYAFWSHDESTGGTDWSSYSNWVDSANSLGSAARFVRTLGIVSRAFDHQGSVYVWGAFAGSSEAITVFGTTQAGGQLQNTYYLYRDDGHLTAKAAMSRAGGHAASIGHLPFVALRVGETKSYAWAGTERRIVQLGENKKSYTDRGPRDITITFDSNEARRCVRLGQTLYISGGEIRQYDGVRLVEVGFHVYPWLFVAAAPGGASLPAGDYFYRSTLRWENAVGEVDRSTTATTAEVTLGAPANISILQIPLYVTHKTTNAPAVEWWRTPVNPDGDAEYHLVSKKDPTSVANPNRYIANDPTLAQTPTLEDALVDADLGESERYPEAPGELENLSPPPATVIAASAVRLFLAGVAGDPDRVWYSKQRPEGRIASFNETLTCDVPHLGGAITALAFVNETLVVFRERAVYVLPGDGYDNTGSGQNYGPARTISLDVGAISQEGVAITPEGVIFKSSKGWHLLDRGWGVKYIGGPVADYDTETVTAVHVIETRHQIRCCTSARVLVFDYLVGQWAEWSVEPVGSGTMWRGRHVLAIGAGIEGEGSAYASLEYGIDIETAWIKPADLQGYVRVVKAMILGEYRSACAVRVRVAYDYDSTYVDDKTWTVSPTVVGGRLQVKHGPKRQQCQALKIRITAVASAESSSPPSGEAFKLTGLALEVGVQQGLFRRLPAAQRQ